MSGPQTPASSKAKTKSFNKTNKTNNPSKKRKAPSDEEEGESNITTTTTTSNKKPKQKKKPTQQDATLDALFDLENGVNTMFARMDPDLLADYVAAQTKRFGGDDLSSVELSDLYVPAGAIRDTTGVFSEGRVRKKENLPEFLEANVGGDDEEARKKEEKRLGTAPKACGAPHTIVVAGAGLRAADLVR